MQLAPPSGLLAGASNLTYADDRLAPPVPPAASGAQQNRRLRLALFGIGALGLLVVVIAAATIAIVLSGATEIGLIRDRVQAALEERLGPEFNVSVGRAIVQVDPTLGLVVDLGEIEIAKGDSGAVVFVPAMRLAVDAMALFSLRLSVTRAEITGPRISLTRTESGGYGLGETGAFKSETGGSPASGSDETEGGFPEFTTNTRGLDRLLEAVVATETARGLHLTVADGSLDLRDPASGTTRTIGDIDLDADVDDATGDIRAELAASGHAGPWTATFTRRTDPGTGERTLSGGFSQLTLADIAPVLAGTEGGAERRHSALRQREHPYRLRWRHQGRLGSARRRRGRVPLRRQRGGDPPR